MYFKLYHKKIQIKYKLGVKLWWLDLWNEQKRDSRSDTVTSQNHNKLERFDSMEIKIFGR